MHLITGRRLAEHSLLQETDRKVMRNQVGREDMKDRLESVVVENEQVLMGNIKLNKGFEGTK